MSWNESKDRTDRQYQMSLVEGDVVEVFVNGSTTATWSLTVATGRVGSGYMNIVVADSGEL